jgi:hypothetical protein
MAAAPAALRYIQNYISLLPFRSKHGFWDSPRPKIEIGKSMELKKSDMPWFDMPWLQAATPR